MSIFIENQRKPKWKEKEKKPGWSNWLPIHLSLQWTFSECYLVSWKRKRKLKGKIGGRREIGAESETKEKRKGKARKKKGAVFSVFLFWEDLQKWQRLVWHLFFFIVAFLVKDSFSVFLLFFLLFACNKQNLLLLEIYFVIKFIQ